MRNIIFTLAMAMIVGCSGGGGGVGQLPLDWEPDMIDLGQAESLAPAQNGQPTIAQLEAALAGEFAILGIDPGKAVSAVPTGKGVKVADLDLDYDLDEATETMLLTLDWTERLVGDNDFNGEVNISDLQPLVLYWEQPAQYKSFAGSKGIAGVPNYSPHVSPESNPPTATNWVRCQIDSDSNGVINLSDIAGIATHYQQRIAGYNVYRRMAGETTFSRLPNPDDESAPLTFLRNQAYQPGTANPVLARPQRYSFIDPDHTPGSREYYVVAADDDGNEASGNPYVLRYYLNDTELDPPIANFLINGTIDGHIFEPGYFFFEPGSIVELNHGNSRARESEATLVEFAYDTNSDGVDDQVHFGFDPVQLNNLPEGVHLIRLRVTDSNGLVSFNERPIFVGVNHPTTVGLQIDVGDGFVPTQVNFSSLGTYDLDTIIRTDFAYWKYGSLTPIQSNGQANILETGDYSCRVTVTDSFGTETSKVESFSLSEGGYVNPGWRFTEVNGETGGAITPRTIGGKPALVYSGNADGSQGLCYKQALDQTGSEWGEGQFVAANVWDSIVFPPILREVDGIPVVAYYEGMMSGRVAYSHALSAEGSSWSDPIEFATGSLSMPALGISSDRLILSTGGAMGVNQFTAVDPLGETWSDAQPLEGHYGIVVDWINVNGQEGLVLNAGSNSNLVLRPQDSLGPWGEAIPLPEGCGDLFQTQAVCDGLLTFWKASESYGIEQFQANNEDATVWGEPSLIDVSFKSTGFDLDVLVIEGSPPWLCIHDGARYELQIIQANDLQASSWGEPEVVTSFGDVGNRCRLIEINGKPGIMYNDHSSDKLMLAVRE